MNQNKITHIEKSPKSNSDLGLTLRELSSNKDVNYNGKSYSGINLTKSIDRDQDNEQSESIDMSKLVPFLVKKFPQNNIESQKSTIIDEVMEGPVPV